MDIVFHGRGVAVSDHMRQRAITGVRRLTERSDRAVDAVIRFEEDGPTRRVEIVLHAPRHRRLVAEAEGRYFGPALTAALGRLGIQLTALKRTVRARAARVRAVAHA
ncbi:MAG: HPF/RaiA family ribosome-associated protein [Gemmatimonadota bacterium]|nr:HPF/RaiA family ribosome-associated protein [Gemmatimonadota bacterium]